MSVTRRFGHGFKNRIRKRTGKGSDSRITGPTEVEPVIEPMTSLIILKLLKL